jgi:hypothetical protein
LTYSTEITTVERRMRTSYAWIGILCLLVALIIVVTFPIPGLGSTEKTSAARTSLVAMGSLYFTSVTVLKYRWRWLADPSSAGAEKDLVERDPAAWRNDRPTSTPSGSKIQASV